MVDYTVAVGFKVDSKPLQQVDKDLNKIKTSMDKATSNNNGTSKLATGFDKVGNAANAARGGVSGIGTELAAMGRLGPAAINPITVGLLAAAAAAVTVVAVFKSVVSTLTDIHQINEVAEVIGVATDKLTAFSAAMQYHGVAIGETQAILQKFSGNISKAVEDSESLAKALYDVGQSPRELEKLNDPVEAFIRTAEGLRGIENINERNRLSMELFGKKAGQVLKELADYERALEIQQRLGNVATKERTDLAARQDEAFKLLRATGESLKNTLVDMFGGSTTQLIEDFAETMEVVALLFRSMIPLVKTWATVQMQMFGMIKSALAPIVAQYMALYTLLVKVGLLSNTLGGDGYRTSPSTRGRGGKGKNPAYEDPNSVIDDNASKAATKAAAAAEEAAEEAAAAIKKYADSIQSLQDKTASINASGVVTNFINSFKGEGQEDLASQLEAANSALSGTGVLIDGAVRGSDGLLDVQLVITQEMEKQALAAGKSTAEYKKQATILANTAIADRASNTNQLGTNKGNSMLDDVSAQIAANQAITAQIAAGQLTTETAIAKAIQEQAYWADIDKQIKDGNLIISKEELEVRRAALALSGQELSNAQQKIVEAKEWADEWKGAVSNTLGSAFDQAWETGRVGFKDLLKDLAKQLIKSAVLKLLSQFMGSFGGGGGGYTGPSTAGGDFGAFNPNMSFAKGGAFKNGTQFFAKGGVVNGATSFGMSNSKRGVMGEAGPEAIMPLTRGSNGKLGVQASGSGGNVINMGNTVINVQSTSDSARDDRDTAKAIDKMLNQKMQLFIANAKRSGNSLNPSFGFM